MKACSKCKEVKPDSDFHKCAQQRSGLYPSCRKCVAARARAVYYKDPEKPRANTRRWSANNKDRKKEADKAYYVENSEKIKARSLKWTEDNPERKRANYRKWCRENPEKHKAIYTKSVHKRRAAKVGASIGDLEVIAAWEKKWRSKRSVKCYWCRGAFKPSECHQDHVIALSKGGAHEIGNLCVSCATCNFRKHAKTIARWNQSLSQPALL